MSKQSALDIGIQIERLAIALDMRDLASLSAMASNLAATAVNDGVPRISGLAAELERAAVAEADWINIVRLTTELLDLCRSTQRCYLDVSMGFRQHHPTPTMEPCESAPKLLQVH